MGRLTKPGLNLARETVRDLTGRDLSEAAGGITTATCTGNYTNTLLGPCLQRRLSLLIATCTA